MGWKNAFEKGTELVLATSSEKGDPHANIVISLGFVDDKLLIANSQMNTTLKNLEATKKICVVPKNNPERYYRIKGTVEIFNSGKYLDFCNNADEEYPTNCAILVSVKEVFDLDNLKKII